MTKIIFIMTGLFLAFQAYAHEYSCFDNTYVGTKVNRPIYLTFYKKTVQVVVNDVSGFATYDISEDPSSAGSKKPMVKLNLKKANSNGSSRDIIPTIYADKDLTAGGHRILEGNYGGDINFKTKDLGSRKYLCIKRKN